MSEERSPTEANCVFADNEDLNSSIIRKVRSRVSEILPNSLSRWFSPSSTTARNGKNGSLRRRRESESDGEEQNSSIDDGNTLVQNNEAPPTKRKKQDEQNNLSLTERPGPSGLNTLVTDNRRLSLPSGVNSKFTSSTPTSSPSLLTQSQKLAIHTANKTSSPYKFTSSHSSSKHKDLGNVIEVITSGSNISGSSRKHLNIPQMSIDRSNSEPPFSPYSTKNRTSLFGTSIVDPKFSSTIRPESSEDFMEEEEQQEEDDNQQAVEEKNNDTMPVDDSYTNLIQNGNGSVSETSSIGDRFPTNELNYTQSEGHRLSGFMGNSRLKKYRGGSTGDLCFSSHLQTEKSLFSERNNLISQMNRPSFNASLYGSTSSLNSSNSRLFANSPFYNGKTTYGGASAYSSKSDLRMKKVLRVPVQIRPSSSLSTLSSSNNSVASEPVALSNTAKRILDIMNSFNSPLSEARKLGNTLNDNVLKIPGLVHNRKRFDEDDLKLNRSIRMQMPRTPYSRPSSSQSFNQPITSELHVPTITQLLQMKKRLQNNTETVRKTASESTSTLNDEAEYKLPNQQDDTNNNVKQTNKIKNKYNRVRESGANSQSQNQENETVPQVILPDVQLPGLKSVPTFDIHLPHASSTTVTATTTTTTINEPKLDDNDKFRFSTPIRLDGVEQSNKLAKNNNKNNNNLVNFRFSEPDPLVSDRNASKLNNSNKSALNSSNNSKLGEFQFNPDMAKPKSTTEEPINSNSSVGGTVAPLKTSGSCLDALKSPAPLKSGSCLDALNSPTLTKSMSSTSAESFGSQFKMSSDKWECDACMVRNDTEKTKCVACGTDKVGAVTKPESGFGQQFKMSSDMWECPTCMIRNQNDKTKCVSCETAKPGTTVSGGVKLFVSAPVAKTTDSGFLNILAQQSAQWECSECMSRNPSDKDKCMACENPKPGSTPALPKFASDPGFKSLASQQASNTWECSACMTRNESDRSKCVCCEQPNPKAVTQTPSFKFGVSPAASKYTFGMPPQTESKEKPEEPKFSFGMPSTASSASTTTTAPKTGFVFGSTVSTVSASTSTETKTGFVFGSTSSSVTSSTSSTSVEPKQKFSFGVTPTAAIAPTTKESVPSVQPVTSGFSFGIKPSMDAVDSSNKDNAKPDKPKKQVSFASSTTSGFSFTSPKPVDEPKKPEVSATTSAFAATKPAMGGFSFGKIEEKKDETDKKGGFSFTQVKTDEIKTTSAASSLFADPKPAVVTTPFAFVTKTTADEPKPAGGFMFTSIPATPATTTTVAEKKPEVQKVAPVFGSAFSVPKTETTSVTSTFSFGTATTTNSSSLATATITPSFGFGGSKPAAIETPKPSIFAFSQNNQPAVAATPENKPSAFGSSTFGSGSTSAAAPVFGSSAASSAFSFGGAAANQAKTETTPFSFGGASTNNPPAFGGSAAPVFGASTTTAQSSGGLPSFGSFSNSAAPPAFGSQTQTSSFGAPSTNAATSIFGSSAPAPPAFGSGTTSGGNTSNVFGSSASFTFGSNHGGQSTGDEPTAKRSSSAFDFSSGGVGVTGSQSATPFAFGGQNNDNNNVKPFNFSANATPAFNFTGGTPGQSGLSATPFQFGNSSNTTSGVFSFGSGNMQETTPNPSAFQFGAPPNTNINPFATQPTGQATTAQGANSQRRKIRASRRMGQSRPVV